MLDLGQKIGTYLMEAIDSIRINFNPDQLFILNLCLGFLMFGVALDLKLSHFKMVFDAPKSSIVGLSSQWVLLPILTLGLIMLFKPPASMALGMILIASCPGGNVSNFAVHLAGANAALSIFLTSITTLFAVVLTPLYFTLLAPIIPEAAIFSPSIQISFWEMIWTILQLIVFPLMLGMILNHRFPHFCEQIHRPVRLISILIFLAFVVVAIYSNFENIVNYLHFVFLIVLVHNGTALLMGYWFARMNRLEERDARAISIETGIQNSGLGLILIFNFFDGLGGMALIAAWWGVWHLIAAFSLAMWWGRQAAS